ncbi:MAG: hypothetical protein ACYDEO_28790 [Aggregatilineales bacterium]
MTEGKLMPYLEPQGIDASIRAENIAAICDYLARLEAVPGVIIDAIRAMEAELNRLRRVITDSELPLGNSQRVLTRWMCEVYGKTHQREQSAGFTPKYCQPEREGDPLIPCQIEANGGINQTWHNLSSDSSLL